MPRIVIKSATGPTEVKTPSGDSVWVCGCGLTNNSDGTCNGNHRKLDVASEDRNTIYQYDHNGQRREVGKLDEVDGKQCCGGRCCKSDDSDI